MKQFFKIIFLHLASFFVIGLSVAQQLPVYNSNEPFSIFSKQMDEYYQVKGRKSPGYKQWKRFQWYQESRLAPDGKIPNTTQLKMTAIQQTNLKAATLRIEQPNLFLASWSQLGPTAVSSGNAGIGRINRLTFHPTTANTFFVSTAGGGLWKTTNAGSNWQSLTDGLPNINTIGLAIDYNSPNTMYLLSGDADSYFSGARGCCGFGRSSSGVYKTFDGGTSWYPTGLSTTDNDYFLPYNIKIHPTNPSILLVTSTWGIYRSVNAGTSWAEVLDRATYDIEFNPGNASIVYASGSDSIYRSLDGGANWSGVYKLPSTPVGRCELAVTPNDPNYVYAMAGAVYPDQFKFRGLFRSVNGGTSFTMVRDAPNILGRDQFGVDNEDQSNYDLSIAVDPLDKNHIITGGIYMWQSFDGGNTISMINPGNNYHADIHDIAFHPLSPSFLYHCSDGGIYRYDSGTGTWANLNSGLAITQYYRISTAQANSIQVTGGAQDNGTHMRKIASTNFDGVIGADGMDNIISATSSSIVYGSIQNSDIYKSINNGASFTKIVDGVTDLNNNNNVATRWLTPMALDPTNNNLIYLGTRPIVKVFETAGLVNITKLNNAGWAEHVLKIAPSDANRLYASASRFSFSSTDEGTKAWRSNDGGSSWTEIYSLIGAFMSDITINPDNPSEIWASFGGYTNAYKVFKSVDGGDNWTNVSGSLPNVPINCIIYQDTNGNPDDALYIGTDIGVFYRDNILGDWIPFSNDLPVVEITDLEIQAGSGLLRAGTYGRGIWETTLYTSACSTTLSFNSSSHAPSTPYFYQASSSITSTAFIVGAGAKVSYRAGGRIILSPGFNINASTGAKFNGLIGSCLSGEVPPGYLTQMYNRLKGYLVQ